MINITRYGWLGICLGLIILALFLAGFFRYYRIVALNCLMDHSTGFYTINNLARFLTLHVFAVLFFCVHFELHVKPEFKIVTIPFSEMELFLILSFIIGAELVKKKTL